MRASTVGLEGVIERFVRPADAATAWGNGVPVLATPILLWWTELACMEALARALEPDEMTVGARHDVRHLAPTPIGWKVEIRVRLVEIHGRCLRFEVAATDGVEPVLSGTHERGVVSRSRFLARLQVKSDRMSIVD